AVASYRLNDSVGQAADSSGNGHDGGYNGSYTVGAAGALVSDGDVGLQLSSGSLTPTSSSWLPAANASRTLEAWVKSSSGGDVVGYGGSGCNQYFVLALAPRGISVLLGCSSYAFAADHPVENGAWHQVAATWDGTALTAYLDGHSLGTQTAPVMATTATNFAIGLEGDNGCCGLSNATVD